MSSDPPDSRLPFASAIATGRGDGGMTGLLFDDTRVQKDDLRTDYTLIAIGVAAALGALIYFLLT